LYILIFTFLDSRLETLWQHFSGATNFTQQLLGFR
jgi:hypothetical protein